MRKKNTLLALLFCAFSLGGWAQGFIHPGILHTQADFDRVKEKLATGQEPWVSAYEKLTSSSHVDLNWKPAPTTKIIRDGGTVWEPDPTNYWNAYRDVATAYQCALVWKISGDTRYADKSIQILNAWARTCKAVAGNSNVSLASGIYGYEFANAGELMRDYEGWSRVDFAAYQKWMMDVFRPQVFDFLERRHGTVDVHYWSNWGLCNVLSAISIGILCDDVYTYNAGMEYYKYMEDRGYAESLHNLVWILFDDERGPFGQFGQMQESNRDQGHATMAALLAADICGVGLNQGEDAWRQDNDRIIKGLEYVAAYNSGVDDLPNEPYTQRYNEVYAVMGEGGRGGGRPNWPRIVNYYENVRGVEVPYSRAMMMKAEGGIDAGGGFYGGNSGGYDHLGFTTLMCTLDPLEDKEAVPTALGGTLQYGGLSTTRTEVVNIPKGETIKILVTLPDGEEDTGNWSWDDDPSCTSPEREFTLDTTGVYRVRYVNAKGVESTRMYSLQVEGDGYVTPCTPYYKVGSVEGNDTLIYVERNSNLTLGLNYAANACVREWKWERSTDGESWSSLNNTTNMLTVNVTNNYSYRLTLVHKSGASFSQVFRVEIAEIDPCILYDTDRVLEGLSLVQPLGASVSLYAEPNSILSQSVNSTRIYKWVVEGDTVQADTLTYHLSSTGMKVADLSDTLTVSSLDTCLSCTLHFKRIASNGAEAGTVYHYDISVYEENTLDPLTTDSFYIQDASGAGYLRNTDGRFVEYDETNDLNYLWQIRRLPSSYGNRYMLISRANSRQHLDENGALTTATDYSKHSFNLWHKYSDEDLYAVQRPTGGLLGVSDSKLAVVGEPCTGFPFRLVRKSSGGGETSVEAISGDFAPCAPLRCGRVPGGISVTLPEEGRVHVYDVTGRLWKDVRLSAGAHVLPLAGAPGLCIVRYVSVSEQVQSAKVQ